MDSEISNLSTADNFKLPGVLWESLAADALVLTDEQRPELDHGLARYERSASDVIPWEQVRTGVFRKQ